MADEFQESDVIFSDHHHRHADDVDACFDDDDYREIILPPPQSPQQHNSWAMRSCKSSKSRKNTKKMANSLPVNIPENILRCMNSDERQLEEEWDDEGMVPPHVIVGRRIAGKMAFSVCTGNGRTLKGRDLSQVRNSILRMTGFLET